MTVSIRIDDLKKQKLDRFLAQLLLREGKKVTLQDAFGLMINYALENEDTFIQNFKELPRWKKTPLGKCLKTRNIGALKTPQHE
jgi:hypothetical protein